MLANNEVGTIQPIAELGKVTRARNVLLHTDAVQGVGKTPFDVEQMNVDLASITAHKIYGPKGIGALFVRRRGPASALAPLIHGGGHERGLRSGTLNVPAIVGFAKACEIMMAEGAEENARVAKLRDRLRQRLESGLDQLTLNGDPERRLPGNLNISFSFVEGEGLMMAVKDVAVSSGSACTSASLEPSYVLKAMGLDEDLAHSSLRFGIGRFNTEAEVDYVADLLINKVKKLREISPLYEMHQQGIDLKSIQWAAH
jgi:cysteine desulfurase